MNLLIAWLLAIFNYGFECYFIQTELFTILSNEVRCEHAFVEGPFPNIRDENLRKKRAKFFYIMAKAYESKGEILKALEYYLKATFTYPSIPQPHARAGRLLFKLGVMSEAKSELKKAIELGLKEYEVYMMLAEIYRIRKNLDGAIQMYRRAAHILPPLSGEAAYMTGVLLLEKGVEGEAEKFLKIALEVDDEFSIKSASLILDRAMKSGDINAQIEILNWLERRRPDDEDILLQLAECHMKISDLEKARKFTSKILKKKPQSVKANLLMAKLFLLQNRFEDALKIAEKIVSMEPSNCEAYVVMAKGFEGLEALESAIKALKKIISIRGEDAEVRKKIGLLLLKAKMESEALTEFMAALRLKKEDKGLNNLINSLKKRLMALAMNKGREYLNKNMNKEAIDAFTEATKLDPEDPYANMGLAAAFRMAGRFRDAFDILLLTKSSYPSLVELDYEMGELYFQMGKFKEAIYYYEKFLSEERSKQFPIFRVTATSRIKELKRHKTKK